MTSCPGCVFEWVWEVLAVSMSCSSERGELCAWSLLLLRISSLSSKPREPNASHTLTRSQWLTALAPSSLWSSKLVALSAFKSLSALASVLTPSIFLISCAQPALGSSQDTLATVAVASDTSGSPCDAGQTVTLSVISSLQAFKATGLSQSTRPLSNAEMTPCSTRLFNTSTKSDSASCACVSPCVWSVQARSGITAYACGWAGRASKPFV